MNELLKDFKFSYDMEVAWGEMDSFSHVNNIYYFRYFENVRIRYFDRIKMFDHHGGKIGPILASTKCKYIRPVTFPDTLRVGARVVDVGTDRLTMEYTMVGTKENELKALGEAVIVAYDYGAKTKVTVPQLWREEIAKIEGRTF